jgi:large subunit ribosomal protein L4
MPKVAVYNVQGSQVDEIELAEDIFGIEPNEAVLYDAVLVRMAGSRRGTASTKERSEVRGGGRKPYRQKGTGRARAGSTRSPLWRGGGIIFGPKPRQYAYEIPKKVRRLALKSALSDKVRTGDLIVVDQLTLAEPKTKEMTAILSALQIADKKALVVTAGEEVNVAKSARNIPEVKPIEAAGLNVYDILAHAKLVMTREAINRVEEVLA